MKADLLARYRERLVAMAVRLRSEVDELDGAIADDGNDPGDLSHLPTHAADRDVEELEVNEAMEHNQVALLNAVEAALGRMAGGSFGSCDECGRSIPVQRLDAAPYAALCLDCQRGQESVAPERRK